MVTSSMAMSPSMPEPRTPSISTCRDTATHSWQRTETLPLCAAFIPFVSVWSFCLFCVFVVVGVVCTWKAVVGWRLTLACLQRSPWLPVRVQTEVSVTVCPFCRRKTFRAPAGQRPTGWGIPCPPAPESQPSPRCSLTYVFPVHVVEEGEAVGGVVADGGGGRGGALGVGVKGGRQQPSLISVQPRPWRLDVHVETWESTTRGQRSGVRGQVQPTQQHQQRLFLFH